MNRLKFVYLFTKVCLVKLPDLSKATKTKVHFLSGHMTATRDSKIIKIIHCNI